MPRESSNDAFANPTPAPSSVRVERALTREQRDLLVASWRRGYLITNQSMDHRTLTRAWRSACADAGRIAIAIHRTRGVSVGARVSGAWSFEDRAQVDAPLAASDRRLTPAGLAAVARAFAVAQLDDHLEWHISPTIVSIGRVSVDRDELLARALVEALRDPAATTPLNDPTVSR